MEELRGELLKSQKLILEDLELERANSVSSISDDIGDTIDHATEERNRELYQLLGERDRKKLELIQNALDNMDDGTYGICEECDSNIAKPRLKAMPFTRLCIECKNEEERTKGKGGALDLTSSFGEEEV